MENKTFITEMQRKYSGNRAGRRTILFTKRKKKLNSLRKRKKKIYILRYNIRLSDECERFGKAGWYFGTDRICRRTG